MSTNNIHLIDDESILKTLDEEISKKLKSIIINPLHAKNNN